MLRFSRTSRRIRILVNDAFRKLSAKGDSGRLLDGVSVACDMLAAKPEASRRIVIFIGESRDRQSKAQFADVLAKAQKNEIVMYAISYSAYATAFTQKLQTCRRLQISLGLMTRMRAEAAFHF